MMVEITDPINFMVRYLSGLNAYLPSTGDLTITEYVSRHRNNSALIGVHRIVWETSSQTRNQPMWNSLLGSGLIFAYPDIYADLLLNQFGDNQWNIFFVGQIEMATTSTSAIRENIISGSFTPGGTIVDMRQAYMRAATPGLNQSVAVVNKDYGVGVPGVVNWNGYVVSIRNVV